MSTALRNGITPKMRPLSPRRSAILCVLDIGTSKVACMIARLRPREQSDVLPNRSHVAEVIGVGHVKSRGMKSGMIADMVQVEQSIRQAVDAAERMAQVQVDNVIVTISSGRLGSESYHADIMLGSPRVESHDIERVLSAACDYSGGQGRAVLHSLPVGYALDNNSGIRDPRGMLGQKLGVDLHVVTTEQATARNLMLCIERCHLTIQAMVAAPFASALAVLTDDEAELGTVCIDMGAGTTTIAVFSGGHFVHCDAVALGGRHITMDLGRGLNTPLNAAERLKVLHGATFLCKSDERDMLSVPCLAEEDRDMPNSVPRAQLIRIIRPRVDEILELVHDRLNAAGARGEAGRRVVLTGGAAQLPGLPDLAAQVFGRQVRVARPVGLVGLPDYAKGAAFAAVSGLTVYPQIAGLEHFETQRRYFGATGTDGYISRLGRWFKESF